jgi:hypothetical protein
MLKKIFLPIYFLFIIFTVTSAEISNIELLNGSYIYEKIFIFFFPISNKYEAFYNIEDEGINFDILIKQNDIIHEPATPSYFETDIVFKIKSVKYDASNEMKTTVIIQCNQKFIRKKAQFKIFRSGNILILKGSINNIKIKDITENEYFQNRFNWHLPIYFDLRFKIN